MRCVCVLEMVLVDAELEMQNAVLKTMATEPEDGEQASDIQVRPRPLC